MIPLVARRDKSPAATLTDNEFLMNESGSYSLAGVTGESVIMAVAYPPTKFISTNLNPGLHRAKIKIVSGHRRWESGIYEITVPRGGASNSHFSVTTED